MTKIIGPQLSTVLRFQEALPKSKEYILYLFNFRTFTISFVTDAQLLKLLLIFMKPIVRFCLLPPPMINNLYK